MNAPRESGVAMRQSFVLTLLIVLSATLLAGLGPGFPRAQAHAGYQRSEPAFAAELANAPTRIDLWFVQELFRRAGANTITLTDGDGVEWPTGAVVIDDEDRRHMATAIPGTLPANRYLVQWTNLSAEDGDTDEGMSVFYVGRAPTAAEREADRALAAELLIPYPGDSQPAGPSASPAESGPNAEGTAHEGHAADAAVDEPRLGGTATAPLVMAAISGTAVIGLVWGRWAARRRE